MVSSQLVFKYFLSFYKRIRIEGTPINSVVASENFENSCLRNKN